MADSCLLSLPSVFAAKSSHRNFSISARPVELNLSCAFSTSFSPSLSLRRRTHFSSVVTFLATQEASTATLEQEDISVHSTIFVGNLSFDVDNERFTKLFEECGVVESAVVKFHVKSDRSRGFGFVTFSTVEEADKAVEKMNGYEVDGRALNVAKASRKGEHVELPRTFETAFKIYVGNLTWEVNSSLLEKLFSEHGKVVDTRVICDRVTGRSRGFGFVAMSNEAEMNAAIAALNGKKVDGRPLKLTVAVQRLSSKAIERASKK